MGSKALVIPMDVSNAADFEKAADRIKEQLDSIDIWLSNAFLLAMSRLSL